MFISKGLLLDVVWRLPDGPGDVVWRLLDGPDTLFSKRGGIIAISSVGRPLLASGCAVHRFAGLVRGIRTCLNLATALGVSGVIGSIGGGMVLRSRPGGVCVQKCIIVFVKILIRCHSSTIFAKSKNGGVPKQVTSTAEVCTVFIISPHSLVVLLQKRKQI